MFKKWKLLKKKKKEPDETFSDWLAQLLTDERVLGKREQRRPFLHDVKENEHDTSGSQ